MSVHLPLRTRYHIEVYLRERERKKEGKRNREEERVERQLATGEGVAGWASGRGFSGGL